MAQLGQSTHHVLGLHADTEAQRHHLDGMGSDRIDDVRHRCFRAQRHQAGALESQHGLSHQEPQAMGLLGEGGQQDPRRGASVGFCHMVDGLPQQCRDAGAVGVLFKHLQLAPHPGVAHGRCERCNHMGHELFQALVGQGLLELLAKAFGIMAAQQGNVLLYFDFSGSMAHADRGRRALQCLAHLQQLLHRQTHDAPGPMPMGHQALDDAQFLNLNQRTWTWKAIAPFPHAQGVFAQARVALNSGNGEFDRRCVKTKWHDD